MHFVYTLKCNDGKYYTVCTQDRNERLNQHQKGYVESTKNKITVELIFYCVFQNKEKAYAFESFLKSGSGIAYRNKHFL